MADATQKDIEQDKRIEIQGETLDVLRKQIADADTRLTKIEKELKALEPFSNFMARWLSGSGGITETEP